MREKRDAAVEALRKKYAPRLTTLEDQIRRAEDRIERERSQLSEQKMQTALSVGTSILGALLGRKKISVTNVGRVGTAARSAGRIGRESGDVARARGKSRSAAATTHDLENEFDAGDEPSASAIRSGRGRRSNASAIKPRKSDIDVKEVALVWVARASRVVTLEPRSTPGSHATH